MVFTHLINGKNTDLYVRELAIKEDMRRVGNGEQFLAIMLTAAEQPKSSRWVGLWQKKEKCPAQDPPDYIPF